MSEPGLTENDLPDAPNPAEQAEHPEADATEPDPTPAEVQPGDEDYVEPYEGATKPTKEVTP